MSDADRLDTGNLGFLLAKASQRWNELLAERFVEHGFSEVRASYGSVLLPLFEEDGLRMGQIAERARLSKQTMTTLVRLCERDGLVVRERDPHDAPRLSDQAHQAREGLPARGRPDPPRAGSKGARRAWRATDGRAQKSTERSDGPMRSETVTTILSAPQQQVFKYMSDIERLPEWATEFARELKREGEDYKVVNGLGEFYFEIKADPETGVIDMFAGQTKQEMAIFPTRAVALPDGRTAFSFTMFQGPEMPDELFESQHQSLEREFANIEAAFAR